MKVVHILNTNSYSGAENVAIQIIKNLNKKSSIKSVYMSIDGPIRAVLEKNNIEFYLVKKINRSSIKKMILELHPDILHCHDYTTSVLAALTTRIKVISHLHNNAPWIKKRGFYSWVYLFTCVRYSSILLVSDSIRKEYIFSKWIHRKILVIGNPIDIDTVVKESYAYEVNKTYDICFLGRLSLEKNPILFIEIIEKLKQTFPKISACMIGDGPLRNQIMHSIKEKKLEKIIDVLGFKSNPYPYLKNSKILLATSRWEGYGLFAVEALVLEKPVVCTDVGGLPTIVNNTCGWVCRNENELLIACSNLLRDNGLYIEKQQGTKHRITELINMNQYLQTIIDAYVK